MKGVDSMAVSLQHPGFSAREIAAALRKNNPPIIARIDEDRVLFELRTLENEELEVITGALCRILLSQV